MGSIVVPSLCYISLAVFDFYLLPLSHFCPHKYRREFLATFSTPHLSQSICCIFTPPPPPPSLRQKNVRSNQATHLSGPHTFPSDRHLLLCVQQHLSPYSVLLFFRHIIQCSIKCCVSCPSDLHLRRHTILLLFQGQIQQPRMAARTGSATCRDLPLFCGGCIHEVGGRNRERALPVLDHRVDQRPSSRIRPDRGHFFMASAQRCVNAKRW
jgi:hypothetical protein